MSHGLHQSQCRKQPSASSAKTTQCPLWTTLMSVASTWSACDRSTRHCLSAPQVCHHGVNRVVEVVVVTCSQTFFIICIQCNDCNISRPLAVRKSIVCCNSVASFQSWVPFWVCPSQNCYCMVCRRGQFCRMSSGVCSSEPRWCTVSPSVCLVRCFFQPSVTCV